ncbi:hypothetical protein BU52_03055 [Streptomyces toyocaensis]|uniref:Uncharacterized protein n=1 Tax=Streptomyces toyocaensis TaxID=55952 RepID=A0A081XZR9_STRTO|nr:hypothetical protein [Streptomyces toyocaensis]KES09042.1 hypothetical protein BU52_03055 [Streptomyces toyocaensis]
MSDANGTNDDTESDDDFDTGLLEEELRQAAAVLDPLPPALLQSAVDAYALHDLDARVAELTFDSLVDALPVRGATDAPRLLTFTAGEVMLDVEVTEQGLIGQVLPPGPVRVELLGGPQPAAALTADDMGRFTAGTAPSGPFALRLRTGDDVVVTEWLRV